MKSFVFGALLFWANVTYAQTSMILKADSAAQTINKNIYGHFAEHLGRCIYGGFYVGDTSKIPNTAGVRNDIVDALKKLKIPRRRKLYLISRCC